MDTPSDIPLPPELWETIPPEARLLLQKKMALSQQMVDF